MTLASRGEVWLVALDPTVGSEIRKTRTCVIVSPDELNGVLRTVLVAPLTSGGRLAPFRVAANFNGRPGLILPDQLRAADRARLIRHVGGLDTQTLRELLDVLEKMFKP